MCLCVARKPKIKIKIKIKKNKTKQTNNVYKENMLLSVCKEKVLTLNPRIQSMLGYSIFPPFIGQSNGMHPLKAIQQPSKL